MRHADVIVVGGGVVGCAAAYFLAREGCSVLVLERDQVGRHASRVAAGMLVPTAEAHESDAFYAAAERSLSLFPRLVDDLVERTGIDPQFVEAGRLCLATRSSEARRLRALCRTFPDAGLEWLSGSALESLQSGLEESVQGGLWAPREAHVRSDLFTDALAQAARGLGVEFETGVEVVGLATRGEDLLGVRTSDGERQGGRVVLCPGAWAAACSDWLPGEIQLPITPVRGQIVHLDAAEQPLAAMLWGEGIYLVPRRDGSLWLGATEEQVGFDAGVTAGGIRSLLDAALRLLPRLERAQFRSAAAGLRPGSPDGLPIVGPITSRDNLAVATGHYRNGVLLSPITGQLLAGWVLGKQPEPWAQAFAPSRF